MSRTLKCEALLWFLSTPAYPPVSDWRICSAYSNFVKVLWIQARYNAVFVITKTNVLAYKNIRFLKPSRFTTTMPTTKHRSRTLRIVYRRTPGGRTVVHYRKRKPSRATCSKCGYILTAVPRERPHIMRKMPKTTKRPERPYGGILCSSCMRRMFIDASRKH